jgi:hypothetical protein
MRDLALYGNKYCVYIHRNPQTEEIFYIGIGDKNRPFERKNRSVFWKNYNKKHGNRIVEIYKSCLSWPEACHLEMHLIKKFGRRGLESNGILVNRTLGGEGTLGTTRILSEETRRKIGDGNRGKVVDEEARRKMSATRIMMGTLAKQVIHIETGVVYNSIKEASIATGISAGIISARLRSHKDDFAYLNPEDGHNKIGSGKYERKSGLPDEVKDKIRRKLKGNCKHARKVINLRSGKIFDTVRAAAVSVGVNQSEMSWILKHDPFNEYSLCYYDE